MSKEQENLPIRNDVLVTASMEFNKGDIAEIAVAKAERRLKQDLAIKMEQKSWTVNEKTKLADLFVSTGENYMNKKHAPIVTKYQKAVKAFQINSMKIVSSVSVETGNFGNIDPKTTINRIQITIEINDATEANNNLRQLMIKTAWENPTKDQISISKKYAKICNDLAAINADILQTKRKLSDIPTLQRQVKAAVLENELNKSNQGRGIVKSMDKVLDDAIKLIG